MAYQRYEDPDEICCGQCGRWHRAPACDAWRWAPRPPAYRLADGSPCVERGYRTGRTTAAHRVLVEIELANVDAWEDIDF